MQLSDDTEHIKKENKQCSQKNQRRKWKGSQNDQKKNGKFNAEISSPYNGNYGKVMEKSNEAVLQSVGVQLQRMNTTIEKRKKMAKTNTTERTKNRFHEKKGDHAGRSRQ